MTTVVYIFHRFKIPITSFKQRNRNTISIYGKQRYKNMKYNRGRTIISYLNLFRLFGLFAPKELIVRSSNCLIMNVPDECYSRNVYVCTNFDNNDLIYKKPFCIVFDFVVQCTRVKLHKQNWKRGT